MMILSKVFIDKPNRTMTLSLSLMGAAAVIAGLLIGGVNAECCGLGRWERGPRRCMDIVEVK